MLTVIYDSEETVFFKLFINTVLDEYTLIKVKDYVLPKALTDHVINVSSREIREIQGYVKLRSYYLEEHDVYFEEYATHTFSSNLEETSYLNLLYQVLYTGDKRQTRNAITRSIFHANLTFDISQGFPMITTKSMFFRGIVEETLMFLRGETNTQRLSTKGIKIWEGNTSETFLKANELKLEERDMGPMYGFQFYHYGEEYKSSKDTYIGYNQIDYVINLLKTDPTSRRMLMTSFNPKQAKEGCLYPCHSIVLQFYVEKGNRLSLICYNRSQDLFLGVPWNIAYAALLVHLICAYINTDKSSIGLSPGMLYIDMGDVHIYEEHKTEVLTQLIRIPYNKPKLLIKHENIPSVYDFQNFIRSIDYSNFELIDYKSHDAIKSSMIV